MSSFGNYVRNDLNIINLIVGNYVDPLDESEGIPAEDGRKSWNISIQRCAFWTGCASRLQRKRVTKNEPENTDCYCR